MTRRRDWRRVFGVLFVATAFLFLGLFVRRNLGELRSYPWEIRPGLLAASVAAQIAGMLWGVWVWQKVLHRLQVRIAFWTATRVWTLSSIARYIPGKVWQFVGIAHLGAGAGVAPVLGVTSLALHMGFFLLAAALSAVYFLPLSLGRIAGVELSVLRWAAPLLLLAAHPTVIRRALRLLGRFGGRDTAEWTAGTLDGLWLALLALLGWVLNGGALYLFIAALIPLEPSAAVPLVGINAFSFLVGYLVFIAPAGLGAKEGALAALLALYVPAPVAALLAVATRLWSVLAEIVPALLALALERGGVALRLRQQSDDGPRRP